MNLKDIYTEMMLKKADAEMDLSSVDPRLISGASGRKRQAEIDVRLLETNYRNEVLKTVVVIGVSGQFSEKFAKIAQDKFKTISVNYFKILDDVSDSIKKRSGHDIYGSNEHFMLLDELNKAKLSYSIPRLPVLQSRFEFVGVDRPLRESIYKNFKSQYGSSLYSMVLKSEASKAALEKEFTGGTLPLVVYNYDESIGLDPNYIPVASVVFSVDEDVQDKDVKDKLTEVRDLLKKAKQ